MRARDHCALQELFRDQARRNVQRLYLDEAYMNCLKTLTTAFLLVPALALSATQARAEFKCSEPQTALDRGACEKAAEGPVALRQYIQRIRVIDSLYFFDYVNEAQAVAWASDASRAPGKSPVQTATAVEHPVGA